MNADLTDDPHELRDLAWQEPNGPARIALLERAVAAAHAIGDEKFAFDLRASLIQCCEFGGAADRAIGPYARNLAWADANPDEYGAWNLLWQYKWILCTLPQIAAVEADQIEAAIEDMDRRFRAAGSAGSATAKIRWRVALCLGRIDDALAIEHDWWEVVVRRQWDTLSDCWACDVAESADLLALAGRHGDALRRAEPVFAREVSCAEVPEYSFGQLLRSLRAEGRTDEADAIHREGCTMIDGRPGHIDLVGYHLEHTAATGQLDRGAELWAGKVAEASRSRLDLDHFWFGLGAIPVLAGLAERDATVTGLPADAPVGSAGKVAASDALAWTQADVARTVTAFDARNGNTWYADTTAARLGEHGLSA